MAKTNMGESLDSVGSEGGHEEQTHVCQACFKKAISQIS